MKRFNDLSIDELLELKVETAQFIFSEAEKFLADQLDSAAVYKGRAESIIQFGVPLLVGLIGYISTKLPLPNYSDFTFWLALGCCVPLIAILLLAVDAYWIYKVKPPGIEPQYIVTEQKVKHSDQYLLFLVLRIKGIQKAINANKEQTLERLNHFFWITRVIQCSIAMAIIVCLIYTFI